jgi:hypothetical protein
MCLFEATWRAACGVPKHDLATHELLVFLLQHDLRPLLGDVNTRALVEVDGENTPSYHDYFSMEEGWHDGRPSHPDADDDSVAVLAPLVVALPRRDDMLIIFVGHRPSPCGDLIHFMVA